MKRLVRDIINVRDLPKEYFDFVVDNSQEFYKEIRSGDDRSYKHLLEGWNVAPIFTQESTRTHDSFLDALLKMGARHDIGISDPKASSLEKGESLRHTIDTYVGYGSHFLVMRDGREGAPKWARISALRSLSKRVRQFASKHHTYPTNLSLPFIFNGGDGSHNHPSQLLLDCSTMKHELGRYENLDVAIMNDLGASRVFASQADASALLGWKLHLYALPGAEMKERERKRLEDTRTQFKMYSSFEDFSKCFPNIDALYIHRYQKNLRSKEEINEVKCHPITLELLEKTGFNKKGIILHARPVDKDIKELGDDLNDHPYNLSDIQSDFGVPTRMAMAHYVINNNLFSLEGIIKSLDPRDFSYVREDLSRGNIKPKTGTDYTTAYIKQGYVIDHIPRGCGSIMQSTINMLLPDVTMILSSNVKGNDYSSSKDVIKIHGNFDWDHRLSNLVALFTDPSAKKSCRISRFEDGKRIDKWAFREYDSNDSCVNAKCITSPKYNEKIKFSLSGRSDGLKECSYCDTIQ
ncbi:MAG: aspartate carbamoyltransferase regulatory subunit [Nanoarchaeota archaeon]|nr:aspartate carbamoyltransferase regulatory subunit [Nanoarchaeota archaeon]